MKNWLVCIMIVSLTLPAAMAEGKRKSKDRRSGPSTSRNPSMDDNKGLDILKSLDYPELQVVPRASDRLKMEAKEEKSNWYYALWPLQVGSLATLGIGVMSKSYYKSDLSDKEISSADTAASAATAIGAGWLLGAILITMDHPYKKGLDRVKTVKGKTKRDQLMRERLAEEALEQPAELISTLTHFTVATNFLSVAYLSLFLDETGLTYGAVAGLLSFLPYIFQDRYSYNFDKHIEYKRKIFAPVAGIGIDEKTGKAYPKLSMHWTF